MRIQAVAACTRAVSAATCGSGDPTPSEAPNPKDVRDFYPPESRRSRERPGRPPRHEGDGRRSRYGLDRPRDRLCLAVWPSPPRRGLALGLVPEHRASRRASSTDDRGWNQAGGRTVCGCSTLDKISPRRGGTYRSCRGSLHGGDYPAGVGRWSGRRSVRAGNAREARGRHASARHEARPEARIPIAERAGGSASGSTLPGGFTRTGAATGTSLAAGSVLVCDDSGHCEGRANNRGPVLGRSGEGPPSGQVGRSLRLRARTRPPRPLSPPNSIDSSAREPQGVVCK